MDLDLPEVYSGDRAESENFALFPRWAPKRRSAETFQDIKVGYSVPNFDLINWLTESKNISASFVYDGEIYRPDVFLFQCHFYEPKPRGWR